MNERMAQLEILRNVRCELTDRVDAHAVDVVERWMETLRSEIVRDHGERIARLEAAQ